MQAVNVTIKAIQIRSDETDLRPTDASSPTAVRRSVTSTGVSNGCVLDRGGLRWFGLHVSSYIRRQIPEKGNVGRPGRSRALDLQNERSRRSESPCSQGLGRNVFPDGADKRLTAPSRRKAYLLELRKRTRR